MEANKFVAKIKADGSGSDVCDLVQVHSEYKRISSKLGEKDRAPFSLNVLCVICRNIDKVPSWRDSIDPNMLLMLSIECVRETRTLTKTDQVKTLACVYHILKHVVNLDTSLRPDLMMKLSFMPFDCSSLLDEYCKTYWNIIADRILYMEKLKPKNNIIKLLPRLIEDIVKVINMYDSIQFCKNVLTCLVKKLRLLYNDSHPKELQKSLGDLFEVILLKGKGEKLQDFQEKDTLDLYYKLCDCFYAVAENASRNLFKDCVLETIVSAAANMFKQNVEIYSCLDAFYLKGICRIYNNITDPNIIQDGLKNILTACISFATDSYAKPIRNTCPFLNQMLRLLVEYLVTHAKNWKESFNIKMQTVCLNIMYYLSTKKGSTVQLLKCDNCKVKSSLHDSLRLLFLIKHFPTASIDQSLDIAPILPIYFKLVMMQHRILHELKVLGCANHEKCFRKLQTDIHNTAITLNKAKYYEYSMKLFAMYVEFEIKHFNVEEGLKNVSRALYNKSICELDCKLYEEAVKDAFLSLAFSFPDCLTTEKYMGLVMDIKAKQLNDKDNDEDDSNKDVFQMLSIVEVCKMILEDNKYGDLKAFLCDLQFSTLLKHEFSMYARLWPSIVPIAGVWRSLKDLLDDKYVSWFKAESKAQIRQTLYEVILETPMVVRSIHCDYYSDIVTTTLASFEESELLSPDRHYIHASLLFLKAEYDMTAACQKYGWRVNPTDPDHVETNRTLPHEYKAAKKAIEAVNVLNEAVKSVHSVPVCGNLKNCLRISQVWTVELLYLGRTLPGLQLADICLRMAKHVSDTEAILRAAIAILPHAIVPSEEVADVLQTAADVGRTMVDDSEDWLVFLSCAAIYYQKCGHTAAAARLVRLVQAKILSAYEKNPDANLELAVGRLLEAQNELCRANVGGSPSAINNTQRHYLTVANTVTSYLPRRYLATSLKQLVSVASARACGAWRALRSTRRARTAAAAGARAAAAARGRVRAAALHQEDAAEAQTKIDNVLKHILGLQQSNDRQEHKSDTHTKPDLFTPRLEQLETMLESAVFKKTQTSPSLPCTSVFAYKMPDYFRHTKCECYACDNPQTLILSCLTSGLEASTYFRSKEIDIARNYFDGTIKSFAYAEANMASYFKKYRNVFESYLVDLVERDVSDDFKSVQIEVFIEAALFESSLAFFEKADDYIVRIHELMQEVTCLDPYLKNEVMNLIVASARLRKAVKKPVETGLEMEMESLNLNLVEEPKTPLVKSKAPPKITKIVVKGDELPNVKRKVIKLNLDDAPEEQEVKKPSRKRPEFKIPVPVTSKPVIETITPRTRRKPDILVTKPVEDVSMTPNSDFSTPISTPAEQFFTPMTSIKTYSKKSLRNNIVKNLEAEFSTPKGDKENSTVLTTVDRLQLPKDSARATRSKVADKKTLKRATSPGKLVKDVKPTRSRLRNPGKFNVHEDK